MKKLFRGRAGRLQYLFFGLLPLVMLGVFNLLINNAETQEGYDNLTTLAGLSMFILLPLAIGTTIKRFHDLGKNGWFTFLLLVPLIGFVTFLVLLSLKGQDKENKYGL